MRQNKAARFNRNMMVMMIFMGVIVLACVYAFLYLSLPQEETKAEEGIAGLSDSISLVIDSIAN